MTTRIIKAIDAPKYSGYNPDVKTATCKCKCGEYPKYDKEVVGKGVSWDMYGLFFYCPTCKIKSETQVLASIAALYWNSHFLCRYYDKEDIFIYFDSLENYQQGIIVVTTWS